MDSLGIEEVKIAPRSPWQKPYSESPLLGVRQQSGICDPLTGSKLPEIFEATRVSDAAQRDDSVGTSQ